MSGFFGIFNRNGKVVERKHTNKILDAMSYWEPDDRNIWQEGSVALGHTMLWNTPESVYDYLPLQKDTYVLTMDARIDNRDTLVKELKLTGRPISEIGDSEFILAAYKKWGEECPKYLLGDFSFVIWDKKKQHFFCARDPLGVKLFHYYVDSELFVFSNDIEGVLSHPNILKSYDEKTITNFMRGEGVSSQIDTFFEQIKKIPGGKVLIVTANKITERAYWKIEDSPKIHYETFEEYVVVLRKLLEDAVEVRLRTQYPVASHLSGGIDSSPIAVLAARKLKKKNKDLHAFNWIDIPEDEDEYEYEAWEFSRRIAKLEQIEHHEFSIDPLDMADKYDEHDISTKETMYFWGEYYILNKSKQIGVRTILSGWGGDELISNRGFNFIENLFQDKKYIETFYSLYMEKKHKKSSWYHFFKRCLRIMNFPIICKYIDWKKKKEILPNDEIDDYIYFKKDILEKMRSYSFKEFSYRNGVRENQIHYFNYGYLQHRIESWAHLAFTKKVEYSYPLLDRRIVEFAVGIPENLYFHKNGHERYLVRCAIKDLLPADILWFPKPDIVKLDIKSKRLYIKSLELWYEKHKNDDPSMYENPYVEYKIILSVLDKYDFNKALNKDNFNKTTEDLFGKIVTAILLTNMIKNKN